MEIRDRMEDDFMDDIFLQDDLCPTIAEHATQCNSLFHRYMVVPEIVPDPTIMDDQLARFTLWASNMDVYGPLNVSLDYRLRFSPTVVEIIHQLLDVICDTLMSCNNVDPAEDNISKITDIIGGTVTRLFRLSNAIRKSAKADRTRKIERYRDDEEANNAIAELRLYTECYVRFRFPMAPDSLRSALVEANAMRLRRLYYQRSHRRRISLSVQNPQTTPTVVQLPRVKESAPAVRFDSSVLPKPATTKKILGPAGPPPVPVTNATTARQSAVRALYAKSTTEVPRAKSVLVNNKLSFPPIPPTHECPYCGVVIEFKSTVKSMLWHNHVIGDLEPFICVFAPCLEAGQHGTGPLTFETSKAWISHMQNAHGHTWECRAPSHDPITFDQEIQYQEHSIKEHGVPETHAGILSGAARRPVLHKVLECPFGDDFQHSEKVESSAVFSSEALQSHVAAHIKEIALITLQKLPSDADENAEDVDSDQPLDDDGPGFANLRASMYSVLDDDSLDFKNDDAKDANGILDHREEDISASCLLEDGRIRSSASQQDNHGWSVLHLAIHSRDLATINILLGTSAIAEPSALFDENGLTAEEWLDLEPTSHYYKATSNLAFGKSRCCRAVTGLRQAVITGNVPMIKLLFRLGHNIDGMNSGRRTALYYAAKKRMLSIMDLLLEMGADPNILPAGCKAWKEFISDDDVLLRLNRASYGKRNTDLQVKRQIQIALRAQDQPSAPDRSASFVPDESISLPPIPDRRFLSAPAPSAPSFPEHSASSMPTRSLAPAEQTYGTKRKAKSDRSAVARFWKRLLR
ncbi:hypothetical protein BDV26DRAFT_286644 [Aspergillus bertholletiae]|uniref:Ankyrin repeat-containing domain protein n=1 Tax=Aspergillus bertholletiae TaxID=1226010 RepID=A0A5N7AQM3_9EURO|nr:hypothetical protein BDV26DRAFT_286644 [Aspergillus bertholletiae]